MTISVIDYESHTASQEFAASLKEIGFAVLQNHPIEQTLIDQVYQDWADFFRSAEKSKFAFDPKNHDGYVSQDLSETAKGNTIKDIKEFYHFYPRGRCPQHLQSNTLALYTNLTHLAQKLLSWIEINMPREIIQNLSTPLSEMIENSQRTLFRIIHYPPLTGEEPLDAVRAAPHEDINLLTLLPAATAKGLQVKNNQGTWLDVPCDPNWIIVNTGDMLQECTEHYYPATTHQVVNPEGDMAKQSRLSMPLFLHPRDDVSLSKRYTAGSYRQERFEELGLT